MNKRKLHHYNRALKRLKPVYFLVLALIFAVIAIVALRENNLKMEQLRAAVYTADKSGGDVQTALNKLQAYVITHMNTNLSAGSNAVHPPIQLKYTYDRLIQAQKDAQTSGNSLIYNEAQKYCETQNSTDYSGRNRVPCIEQYVQSHSTVTTTTAIPDALYKFDFVSPRWSPDLAGWSLVLSATSLVTAVILFIVSRRLDKLTND